jgi:hypothetical protein
MFSNHSLSCLSIFICGSYFYFICGPFCCLLMSEPQIEQMCRINYDVANHSLSYLSIFICGSYLYFICGPFCYLLMSKPQIEQMCRINYDVADHSLSCKSFHLRSFLLFISLLNSSFVLPKFKSRPTSKLKASR